MVLVFIWIRRWLGQRLILLLSFFFYTGCTGEPSDITIIWEDDRPVGVSIPLSYLPEFPDDSIGQVLPVHLLSGNDQVAILGEYSSSGGSVIFKPLIPFTRELTYEVKVPGRDGVRFTIPAVDPNDRPALMAIYPSQDTLPNNLLKMYLKFSRPMREGQSLNCIVVLRNGKDTIPDVFLDLQPELWNYDRSVLTLWLDPGRIKRDLQPNQKLGMPLEEASSYRLVISTRWMDTRGASLRQDYHKDFFVIQRDSLSPNLAHWKIIAPKAGTRKPVIVNFYESLDYIVLQEAIRITDTEGNPVSGSVILSDEESVYQFVPTGLWSKGTYLLQSEARLEDLAGNNLNRPFDRDLVGKQVSPQQEVFIEKFQVN